MKKLAILFLSICAALSARAQALTAADVLKTAERVADFYLENPSDCDMNVTAWDMAPFYNALIELSRTSGDPKYWAEVLRFGDAAGWDHYSRPYFANDHAVCQAWLDTYAADKSKTFRFAPSKKLFETVVADEKKPTADAPANSAETGASPVNPYTWCDALYMSPPAFARMYALTGNAEYLDYLDRNFRMCSDAILDKRENLFYRDSRFIGRQNINRKKILWGRGNGWVVAALPSIISAFPTDDPRLPFYKSLYENMAKKLLSLYLDGDMWCANLVDRGDIKGGEASATGFIIYALAWGVNNGLLDSDEARAQLLKSWSALAQCVESSGKVGYVQPPADGPARFSRENTSPYGAAAVILAGCEIAKMLGAKQTVSDSDLLARAEASDARISPEVRVIFEPRGGDIFWGNKRVAFRVHGGDCAETADKDGIKVLSASDKTALAAIAADCGGTAILIDGVLYKAGAPVVAHANWSNSKIASLTLKYVYDIKGEKFFETKVITLAAGEDTCTATSFFRRKSNARDPVKNLEVAAILRPSSPDCKVRTDYDAKELRTLEEIPSGTLRMFLKVDAGTTFSGFKQIPPDRLILMKTDKNGKAAYTFGCELEHRTVK